jgi:chromosome segregation ATPase
MKNRTGIIVLALICLGLGIATIYVKKKASEQHSEDQAAIMNLSNQWVKATANWEEQKQVSAMLQEDVKKAALSYAELSNHVDQVSSTLDKTSASLKATETKLASTEAELKEREARIAALETANQALDKQATELSTSITNLTIQITETKRRLAASEGDKAFLEKELKRLVGEKAELEKQFNDLAVLRAQVVKLKEELNVARRAQWIRQGLFASPEEKGAARLMKPATTTTAAPKQNYDLNVEISREGGAKIVPATNAPAAKQ